ncbi:MAG: DUF1631 domain-containing protein [Oleiphilus sp.]|nr:MAG: DUF1631 domain-containing protein [Oleiphilus sp.]
MSGAKVVGIHGGNSGAGRGHVNPLPAPLVKLRELLKQKVHTLLRNLFDSADDALFAMADKAGTNNEQTVYFDAMRELRLQKKHIATNVIKGVIQSFNEIGHYRSRSGANKEAVENLEDLSLVQNDDLEIKVAIEGMITRVRSSCGQVLDDLHLRTGSLIAPVSIDHEQMPAGPEILCDTFLDGCSELDINIRAQLVVLKLFEKFVLSEMTKVYRDANALFIQLGVAPDIKQLKRTPTSAPKSAQTQSNPRARRPQAPHSPWQPQNESDVLYPNETFSNTVIEEQFDDLRQLLHQGDVSSGAISAEVPTLSNVYYSQGELVGALSSFQTEHMEQLGNANTNRVLDFRALLNQRLASGDCQADYSEMDADVINLVSMLFEFILDDRQLQPAMKALLSRLQIPILKVALMDRSFFNRGGHPARKLLNEMAKAAIGWNEPAEGKKDRLKDKIESVVERVLEDFDQDVALFAELLEDFVHFVDLEQRRGQLVEQRTKDSEKGKVASDLAKQAAQESLNASLKGRVVPDYILELLRDGWSSVMVLHYLKEGEDGESWLDACALVDELLWSIEPETGDEHARGKLLKMIPGLMKRLRAGLKEVSFDGFRTKHLLQELEESHVLALQSLQASQLHSVQDRSEVPEAIAETEQTVAEDDEAIADLVRSTMELEEDFRSGQSEKTEPSEDEDKKVEGANIQDASESEEIVLVSAEPDQEAPQIDESDPFVQQVDKFAIGCWFEFQNGGATERCKLAAVIRATGKYIFVNRSGIKVAEKTRMGLAVELRRGSIQILNDGLLFDRALESIITNLRSKNS